MVVKGEIAIMALKTRKLHPLFGAEIIGVDVAKPVDDATFAEIRAALDEHSLLLFRGLDMTDERQIAFSERFGPLLRATSNNPGGGTPFSRQSNLDMKTGEPIPADDKRMRYQKANEAFHSDGSYRVVPSLCSLLSGRVVPPEGGATDFTTMRGVWDALPADKQRTLEGLIAEHSLFHSRSLVDPTVMNEEQRKEMPPVRQAVVRANPVNGRKAVFLGAHASHIVGWPVDEGRALIGEIMALCAEPRFVYSHQWREGDLLVYDNRCLLHRATPYDIARHRRILQRTTISGDAPTAPQA
jgi:alpha-ketoglutarate-dependent 2,4-dichlorophenoxyacetate dioxygenase